MKELLKPFNFQASDSGACLVPDVRAAGVPPVSVQTHIKEVFPQIPAVDIHLFGT